MTTGVTKAAKRDRKTTANGNGGSKWIRKERRLALYLRDRFTCLYCLKDLSAADPRDITLDHVTGGHKDHSSENLVCACRSCNSAKGDIPLSRFAGPETRAHIRRNRKRSMTKYLKLAKALISGEVGFEETIKGELD
jgi:5-methylcytosine-specific restriction endonuclease McrA